MKRLLLVTWLLMLLEQAWKHWMVVRFFRRPVPRPVSDPRLVSILQPVLSGDPTMACCLQRCLQFKSRYPLEVIWLADQDDLQGQRICQELLACNPERTASLLIVPAAREGENPKIAKLIAGVQAAHGEILCVLDDDTMLPDDALEQCLPFLDQPGVGLAFGLPYYVNFSDPWSSMVATFVNSNSLLTYIPYTTLSEPFTINGMFYALRRSVLAEVGGFEVIREIFADDFAVAQLLRVHGYRLAQTPLLHAISTQVKDARHYLSLIQRWFVLPRESLLRHLNWYERCLIFTLGLLPMLFPLCLLIALLVRPSRRALAGTLLYAAFTFASFSHLNQRYLHQASPRGKRWWLPVVQIIFPLQLLIALRSPQKINWRGNIVRVDAGGRFHYVRRRNEASREKPAQTSH